MLPHFYPDKSVVLLNLFLDKSVEASAQVTKKQAFSWKFGVVLCNDNLSMRGNVTYAPIYMLMFIEKQKNEDPKIYKLNLDGLV